jgi:hypothetical protein
MESRIALTVRPTRLEGGSLDLHSLELTNNAGAVYNYIRQTILRRGKGARMQFLVPATLSWFFLTTTALIVYLIPLLRRQCSFSRYGAMRVLECHRASQAPLH